MTLLFPKPQKRRPEPVEEPEGPGKRQVCSKTAAGIREYRSRTEQMWTRQEGLCALCMKPMRLSDSSFDHQNGRGGGKRDDRIVIDGRPHNAAVHFMCNSSKGSRRIEYLIQPHVTDFRHIEELLQE